MFKKLVKRWEEDFHGANLIQKKISSGIELRVVIIAQNYSD